MRRPKNVAPFEEEKAHHALSAACTSFFDGAKQSPMLAREF
jgi:hypothetical protein